MQIRRQQWVFSGGTCGGTKHGRNCWKLANGPGKSGPLRTEGNVFLRGSTSEPMKKKHLKEIQAQQDFKPTQHLIFFNMFSMKSCFSLGMASGRDSLLLQ